MSPLQKKLLIIAIISGLLIILGGIFYWLNYSHKDNAVTFETKTSSGQTTINSSGSLTVSTSGEVGFISEITGEASLLTDSKRDTLTTNMKLLAGSTIVTEENSTVSIILNDNSILRLSEKTSLVFSDINKVKLDSGDVWARIIKPLTDDSLFIIETSDSSAGVRGTAVLVQKMTTRTLTTVVDSSLPQDSVVLTTFKDGNKEEEKLNPEDVVEVSKQGKKKQKRSTEELLDSSDTISNFLKQDILYLILLEEKFNQENNQESSNTEEKLALIEKIKKEIAESLPKDSEIQNFFTSESTRNAAKFISSTQIVDETQSGALRSLTPAEYRGFLLEIIQGEHELIQEKEALKRLRNSTDESAPAEERKQKINEMEEKLRDKESQWGVNFEENFKKKFDKSENPETTGSGSTDTGTGTTLEDNTSLDGGEEKVKSPTTDIEKNSNVVKPNPTSQSGTVLPHKNVNNTKNPQPINTSNVSKTIASGSAKPIIKQPIAKQPVQKNIKPIVTSGGAK